MRSAMNLLKVKITQSQAHYRVPFSYQRRLTYPIPLPSTVKGLICNIMGIQDNESDEFKRLKNGLSLAIYGKFESMVKEYTWFRNLSAESHTEKFNSVKNRIIDNTPQHPGGQMPVIVDVLNEVTLLIYIYHPDESFLEKIKKAFEEPSQRLTTIHLGRAEDWLVFEEVKYIELRRRIARKIDYFTWIPEKEFTVIETSIDDYEQFFKELSGNRFRIPTFYRITESNQRVFDEYITAKLHECGGFKGRHFLVDADENIPVILTKLSKGA